MWTGCEDEEGEGIKDRVTGAGWQIPCCPSPRHHRAAPASSSSSSHTTPQMGARWTQGATSVRVQRGLAQPSSLRPDPRACHGLTCSTFSSFSSVKTVPSIWLGFSATQLKTGMRNLVWIGFFTFTAR